MTMEINEISGIILDCSYRIHSKLGPGLLESVYEECLAYELNKNGLSFHRQLGLPLVYDTIQLDCGYRCDFIVEDKIVIELKAVEAFNDVHMAQVLTYLKLTKCQLGLLINFNVAIMKNGFKRVALNL